MTDLNHTVPMTEEDMNKVRSLFERGADAIVNASKLAQEVNELRQTMTELKQSYEEVVANNRFLVRQINALETELTQVKTERDEARMEVSHFNQKLAGRDHEINELQITHNQQAETIVRLRRESDDHMMRALQAEEKVEKVEAKVRVFSDRVAQAQVWFTEIEDLLHPEEPVAEEVKEPFPLPEGVTVLPLDTTTPEELHNVIAEAVGEPEQKIEPKEEPSSDSPSQPAPWQRYGFGA